MRRGGYSTTGEKKHVLKVRFSPAELQALRALSEEREEAMAFIVRKLLSDALEQRQAEPESFVAS